MQLSLSPFLSLPLAYAAALPVGAGQIRPVGAEGTLQVRPICYKRPSDLGLRRGTWSGL